MAYEKELAFAKDLAHNAGDIMRQYFRTASLDTTWKEDDTPLTVADTAINDLVIEKVKITFPDDGVIGEEGSYETDRARVWVVDPIDGTMPFTIGIPVSTFSLGLVDKSNGQSVLGVTYDPQLDEMYWACRSQGAFLNGKRITTSQALNLKNTYVSVIGGTKQQRADIPFNAGACLDLVLNQDAKPLCLLSQVYSALKVASGELTGSIFGYGSPWDSAAVSVITEEAGGIVTDAEGNKRRYDEWGKGCILAANQTILDELLKIVKAA